LIDLEENSRLIEELKDKINKIYIDLKLESKAEELKVLENKTLEEGFWNDSNASNSVLKQIKDIKNKVKQYNDFSVDLQPEC